MDILALGNSAGSGNETLTFVVSLSRGQIHAQLLNHRLRKQDVAALLKTNDDSVSFLVEKGFLKVLGHPAANQQRFFSATEIFDSMQDRKWLSKVTDALYEFNSLKNAQNAKRNVEKQ